MKKIQDFLIHSIDSGLVEAAHDLAEGGLLVAGIRNVVLKSLI